VNRPEPQYSEAARKAKRSGMVLLSLVIDASGLPTHIWVLRPLGLGLDESAVETVKTWRFKPGMKGEQPVAILAQIEITFRLL
jgi:protein TonB